MYRIRYIDKSEKAHRWLCREYGKYALTNDPRDALICFTYWETVARMEDASNVIDDVWHMDDLELISTKEIISRNADEIAMLRETIYGIFGDK